MTSHISSCAKWKSCLNLDTLLTNCFKTSFNCTCFPFKIKKNDTDSKVQSFDFVPLKFLAFGCFSNQSSRQALTLFSRQCFTAFAK